MNITLGIYSILLFFLYVIVPGHLFRRFYYNGEFSKELSTKSNHIYHLIYSSFIGILIIFFFTSLLNCSDEISIRYNELLINFQEHYIKEDTTAKATFFKDNNEVYTKYLPFLLSLYVISMALGYFTSTLIILLRIDTKSKLLRFKNEWYYIFNGKLLRFKKITSQNRINVKYTYLDLLVKTNGESPTLYSGFLANYELNFENISKIERIHLIKAVRRDIDSTGNRLSLKPIPGNIFTILGENIINLNCTYIVYNSEELKRIRFERLVRPIVFIQLLCVLFLAIMFFTIIIMKTSLFDVSFLKEAITKSLWYRLTLIYFLNVIVGFVTPFEINRNELKVGFIGLHDLFLKIILSVLLFGVLYFNRY